MINPNAYPFMRGAAFIQSQCQCISNPLITWLAFGKLPQDITVTSSTSDTQVVTATAANRYLNKVTVLPTTSTDDSTDDTTTDDTTTS